MTRDSSVASAERFFAATKSTAKRQRGGRPAGPRVRPATARYRTSVRWVGIPKAWQYVEKHAPGAFAAWVRDVRLPVSQFSLGVTGKPPRAVAMERKCIASGGLACTGCRRMIDGRWLLVEHAPAHVVLDPNWPEPHVDEHW